MSDTARDKGNFLYTPLPVSVLKPLKFMVGSLAGGKKLFEIPESVTRLMLVILGIMSMPLIWILEGAGNPLELLVDIPFFSISEYPGEYNTYYFVFILFFSMLFLYILQYGICGGKEFSFFSLNGILVWLVSMALGILADSFTRNIFLEKYFLPLLDRTSHVTELENYNDKWIFILLLIITLFAFYYALSDAMTTSLSVMFTPCVLMGYDSLAGNVGIFQNTLVKYLIITVILKLILMAAEKLGVIKWISDLVGKYFYTPRYMPICYLHILLIPLWPVLIVFHLYRYSKKKKTKRRVEYERETSTYRSSRRRSNQ